MADLFDAGELGYTPVTDAGLRELQEMKRLTWLGLLQTKQLTPAGLQEFRAALPQRRISR